MSINVNDYLIDHAGIDWKQSLTDWHWLLPSRFTIWLVNRLCDLFIETEDGSIHMLDTGLGSLTLLATNRDEFLDLIDQKDNHLQWLAIRLVDDLISAQLVLKPGECYGFKIPPVIGGSYDIENIAPIPIADYLGACGSIHHQIKDFPNGTQVVLNVINFPSGTG